MCPDLQDVFEADAAHLIDCATCLDSRTLNKPRRKGGTACCPLLHTHWATSKTAEYAATICFPSFRWAYIQETPHAARTFAHPPHRSRVARRGAASAACRTGRYAAPPPHCRSRSSLGCLVQDKTDIP